jgi:hypothetical protein
VQGARHSGGSSSRKSSLLRKFPAADSYAQAHLLPVARVFLPEEEVEAEGYWACQDPYQPAVATEDVAGTSAAAAAVVVLSHLPLVDIRERE